MRHLATIAWLIAAAINLLPLVGVLGQARLESLYGVALADPNLVLLLRHRAVLFGVLGGLLVVAAFQPRHRPLATIAGLVSMLSFVALAATGTYNSSIERVIVADWIAIGALLIASLIDRRTRNTSPS